MPLTLETGSSQLFQGPFIYTDRSQKCPCSVLKRLGTLSHKPTITSYPALNTEEYNGLQEQVDAFSCRK